MGNNIKEFNNNIKKLKLAKSLNIVTKNYESSFHFPILYLFA